MPSLYEEIVSQYESNGFKHSGNLEDGHKFSNRFSRYFLFILPSVQELMRRWKSLQAEVIEEYRHFKDESFLEWNFYTIFVLEVQNLSGKEKTLISDIEQDRSYTRKYVRTAGEISLLPPGVIRAVDLTDNDPTIVNFEVHWKSVLGDQFFNTIMNGPKYRIEQRILKLLERSL